MRFLHVESLMIDSTDPAAAIAASTLSLAPTDARLGARLRPEATLSRQGKPHARPGHDRDRRLPADARSRRAGLISRRGDNVRPKWRSVRGASERVTPTRWMREVAQTLDRHRLVCVPQR